MGVITQGILGGFSGKVGPVVGGKWKDIDYMRGYVIPANPNTSGQQLVRAKFAKLVLLAKSILPTIIQTYWDPFYSNMSGFNAFIGQNYSTLDGSNDLQASSKLAIGSLESLHTNTSTYVSGTGILSCAFDETISGNGLVSDDVHLIVYDKNLDTFFLSTAEITRADSPITVNCGIGKTATNLISFVFASRGTGAAFIVSDSVGDIAAV